MNTYNNEGECLHYDSDPFWKFNGGDAIYLCGECTTVFGTAWKVPV